MTADAADRYGIPEPVAARADLHLHSTCSDGRAEPQDVVTAALACDLAAIALTDHDTVAGIAAAGKAASAAGVEFVPGIEFSCYDETGSTHLLGYYIDANDRALLEFLEAARKDRVRRAEAMVGKLNELGIGITFEAVRAEAAQQGLIARPHVARALVAGGWVDGYGEAFARFIAAGQPAYVPTQRVSPAEGIRRIHEAGGLAVLAHAGKTHTAETIRRLVDEGLDGLETLHPDHGKMEVSKLRKLAAELEILETGGSDWHGALDSRRGQLASQPVPYEWYERLRDAAVLAERRGRSEF